MNRLVRSTLFSPALVFLASTLCYAQAAEVAESLESDETSGQSEDSHPSPKGEATSGQPSEESSGKPEDKKEKTKPQKLTCVSCEALDPRLSGHLTSEVYLMQRSRARILGNGVYWIEKLKVYPFYETMELRADEVYHKGLSIHFQGWAGVDLNDVYFDDRLRRVAGDPTYLYVQFHAGGFSGTAGRQMVYTGTVGALHLDGIHASYELPIHVGIEGLGGLVVSPYLGPQWYREQPGVDFDSFGPGFSDWEREGEYAVGGRVFYRRVGLVSGGVSLLHVTELNEVSQQLIGADLVVTPLSWCTAYLNGALDLPTSSIQHIDLGLDFYPFDILSVSAEYGLTDPTLFLSHMSIFSIFSSEQYHSVGGTARIDPLDWLQVHAGYHHHLYNYDQSQTEDGFEVSAGVTFKYLENRGGVVLIDYRRLSESVNGLHDVRTGVTVPFAITGLKAAANLYLDIYDNKVHAKALSFVGDVGLFYTAQSLMAGASVSAGTTPYNEDDIRGMLKFAYNFEKRFVERKHP